MKVRSDTIRHTGWKTIWHATPCKGEGCYPPALQQIVSARAHMRSALGHFHDESDADVEEDLNALLAEARATIIKIRGALA